jgi:hypothetical protein
MLIEHNAEVVCRIAEELDRRGEILEGKAASLFQRP